MSLSNTREEPLIVAAQLPMTASVLPASRRPRWRRLGSFVFWLLFFVAGLMMMFGLETAGTLSRLSPAVRVLVSPLMLAVLWFTLRRFRAPIHRVMRWLRLPSFVKFLLVGVLFGIGLGANFSVSFGLEGTDIYPNPLINMVAYIGIYGGVMLSWYALKYLYAFEDRHVFWVSGSLFSLFEQGGLLPITLLSGNVVLAILLYVYLVVIYGVPFATPWVMMPPEELPRGRRRFRLGGVLLSVVLSLLLYNLVGEPWFAIMQSLLDVGKPNH